MRFTSVILLLEKIDLKLAPIILSLISKTLFARVYEFALLRF